MKNIIIDEVVLSRPLEGPLAAHIGSFARWTRRAGISVVLDSPAGADRRVFQPVAWPERREIAQPVSSSTQNGICDIADDVCELEEAMLRD